jgi:hypothetical protein
MSAGVTFSEMVDACLSEATRIEVIQADLVATGIRAAPDPGKMRLRDVFSAIVRMIKLIRSDPALVERLKKKAVYAAGTSAAPPAQADKSPRP